MKYAIYVPCYNEEKCLYENISKLDDFMGASCLDYGIIIVDDCSTDRTKEIALQLREERERVGVEIYSGDRPSRREHLLYALSYNMLKADVISFIDCDLSTDIKDLPKLLTSATKGKVIIGDRYHKDSKISRSLKRFLISKCLNLYTKYLFNTNIDDHFIGFKAFNIEDFKKISYCMGYFPLRSMWADAEMLIWAIKNGIEIKQIPVKWKESKFTKLNYRREFGIILYSLWFRLGLWMN